MIIPADKTPTGILPVAQTQPLQSGPAPQTYMSVAHEHNEDDPPPPYRFSRSRRRRRILRAFLTLALTFLTCKVLISSKIRWPTWKRRGSEHDDSNTDTNLYEIPPDLVLDRCLQGEDWETDEINGHGVYRSANLTFNIPLSVDNIFLLSRGQPPGGGVTIMSSPDQPKDTVSLSISARYFQESVLSLTKACHVSRNRSERGVGLFSPIWFSDSPREREDTITFFVVVTFPESSQDRVPFAAKGFATDVPDTTQMVQYLKSKVHFDSFSLKGTNAGVYVKSLYAKNATIVTSNGSIHGIFNALTSVLLRTSNARMDVDVNLISDSSEPKFSAEVSNGEIDAALHLSTVSGNGGKFNVSTSTDNAPVSVRFLQSPFNSTLNVIAATTNRPISVSLHPAYEGDFDIQTSSKHKAEVKFFPAEDPSGRHRVRGTGMAGLGVSHVSGYTIWNDNDSTYREPGAIRIDTTNADVVLNILG